MALLALRLPRPLPPPRRLGPYHDFHLRLGLRLRRRRLAASNAASLSPAADGAAAVVWFKHDLRVDDHPGLAAAAAAGDRPVVPLYVFDPRILAGYSDTMLELLLFAVEDLKMLLKSQESDLLVAIGNAEDIVLKLVNEVKAGHIFTEEEVEYSTCSVIANVESSLSNGSFTWGSPPKIVVWSAPLYDYKSLRELSVSYNQFLKDKLSMTTPIAATTLPALNVDLDAGALPTLEELKGFLKDYRSSESWISCKNTSAKAILRRCIIKGQMKNDFALITNSGRNMEEILTGSGTSGRRIKNSMFASEGATEVRGGTSVVLDALAAYLRYLEGTGKDNWQELHDKARLAETRNGASFYTLFGPALRLGVISRRRVYYEAIEYDRQRNGGFLSPFGYSTPTVTAAINAICSMEWYWLLGLKSLASNEGNYPIRIWRWKGYLIQYTAVGHEGPAVVLVHGFGAFLEHFRDNIGSIADAGHRVWAITLLGFGKSEKPNVNYTELMWAELLRDFIVDVVAEPVHLVGNSIGGYISAIAAGLWSSLAKSLVVVNTAGSIVPSYSSIPLNEEGGTSWLSRLQARILLLYLRSRAGTILKEYYPTKAERVDKLLMSHITRASYDPGAATVLESVFNFNLSIPLNFLFDCFGGKVLVIQGMKDPLTKSESFISLLRQHCSMVEIRELDAGHAPHDELPNEVNSILCEWTKEIEVGLVMEKSEVIQKL